MKLRVYYKEVYSLLLLLLLILIIAIDIRFITSREFYDPASDFNYFLQLSNKLVQTGEIKKCE